MFWHILQSGERCPGHTLGNHVCKYDLVDRCPHDYRVQGFDGARSADLSTCDEQDAIAIKHSLEARGFRYVSIMPPRCTVA